MGSEWRAASIESIATKIAMGPFGSDIKAENFASSGVPVIRGGNLTSGRFRGEDFVFLTEEKANELMNANAYPGDLVFTHRGTLGQVGLLPNKPYARYVVSQSQMKLTCDKEQAIPEYIYYYFKSPIGQNALLMNTSQTGVPAISRPVTSLKAIRLHLPPLSEQRAIAHILGTFDDKIELNKKTNETLEAMAQALFNSWFVDFDSVASEDMYQSEMGLIPKGWNMQRISKFMVLSYGKSLPEKNRHNGSVPVYGSGGVTGFHDQPLIAEKTIIVGRKGTVGSLYWESRPCFPIDTVFYVQPILPLSFCYYLLKGLPLRSMNTDAAVPGLNRENVYRLEFPLPPLELISLYSKNADVLREKMDANFRQIENLVYLRDLLLPKLISGQLRIKDAEKFLESHI